MEIFQNGGVVEKMKLYGIWSAVAVTCQPTKSDCMGSDLQSGNAWHRSILLDLELQYNITQNERDRSNTKV